MSEVKLKAYSREQIEAAGPARKGAAKAAHQLIPAEMYGPGFDNVHLAVAPRALEKIFKANGKAMIVDLEYDGQEIPVIIKAIQRHYLKNNPIHADFYRIKDDQKVNVETSIKHVGKSFAVSNLGGILIKNLQSLKIECLPKYLVKEIEVDLGKLATIHGVIRVEDLAIPEGITVKNNGRDPVVSVLSSRKSKSDASAGPATTPANGAAAAPAKAAPKKK